jgi:hypothetical protein
MGLWGSLFTKPADTIEFNRGEFMVFYATARSTYAVLALRIEELIKSKKLALDAAMMAKRVQDQMRLIDAEIQESMRNPEIKIDWKRVLAAVEMMIKLLSLAR